MKIVYIAHPISGDIAGNLEKVRKIVRDINLNVPDVTPFAHYFVDCHALDDDNPNERQIGINNDITFFNAGFISEVWLYGDKISTGMSHEIALASSLGIPVVSKSEGTKQFAMSVRKVTPEARLRSVLKEVSNITGVSVDDMRSSSRKREVVEARQFYFKKAKDSTKASFSAIGKIVHRDHSTVIYGISVVDTVEVVRERYEELFEGKKRTPKNVIPTEVSVETKGLLIGRSPKMVNMSSPFRSVQSETIRAYSGYRVHSF